MVLKKNGKKNWPHCDDFLNHKIFNYFFKVIIPMYTFECIIDDCPYGINSGLQKNDNWYRSDSTPFIQSVKRIVHILYFF
jgi:hypothetical protein